MIPKSGNRFSDKIMRQYEFARAPGRKTGAHFCWSRAFGHLARYRTMEPGIGA